MFEFKFAVRLLIINSWQLGDWDLNPEPSPYQRDALTSCAITQFSRKHYLALSN